MVDKKEPAKCRGCGLLLKGTAYFYGGDAYHPVTGIRCRKNHYGGYVCSEDCDRRVIIEMESSFPGAGLARRVPPHLSRDIERSWRPEND